ncbi:hypothetical protein ABE28_023975 (plasmid) [Peribacillus muralis]|uniref:Uncharacterized protein n=1 Tax=Peribacillus muralis TaxID=264697 RepID=A0A1B3XW29_9BACI|nr:hypothetical protein ABE28_023975 [Peribacillus muralis]
MSYSSPAAIYDASSLVEDHAWFVVLLAVLMTFAFTLFAAMAAWCFFAKDRKFSGKWNWNRSGVSLNVECK